VTRPLIFDARRERNRATDDLTDASRRAMRASVALGKLETSITETGCFEAVRTLRGALALEMVRAK
jgi:hypothetical protein